MTNEINLQFSSDGGTGVRGRTYLMWRSQHRMNKSGFSLLDTIIVMSVIGLLAGVSFPRLQDLQSRFAVRGAVTAFMSAHSLTRATAIREGGVAELHIDATNDRFWIEVDTTLAGSGVMDTIGFVIDVGDQGVTLSSTQSLLCFEGRGMPSSVSGCATTGATISFNFLEVADTILITTLGKILR